MTLTVDDAIRMLDDRGGRTVFLAEAGSRGWGTAAPDSDHDLVAVTMHPASAYASLLPPAASLKLADTPELSLVSFDVRQALTMTANGNPYLGERCASLVVHASIPGMVEEFRAFSERCFDRMSATRCWLKEGKAVFLGRIDKGDEVESRRYANLLRPAMAVRRLLAGMPGLPPADIRVLAREARAPLAVTDFLEGLVERRKEGVRDAIVPRMPLLEQYWNDTLAGAEAAYDADRSIPDWKDKMDEGTALVLQWTASAFEPSGQPRP